MSSEGTALSKREQAMLAAWERSRRRTISLKEIGALRIPDPASVANRLVRKRVLERIGRGFYAIRPFRSVGAEWAFPALVTVELILGDTPHYVGGLAAFTLNSLTDQQHTSLIDVFVRDFRRSRRVGNADVEFHRRKPAIFESGTRTIDVDGFPVRVSDKERTIVDALDQFPVVGGMPEAIRLFRQALPKVDRKKVVEDALRVARSSSCQRLGVLLERAGMSGRSVARLHAAVTPTSIHLLVPGRAREGVLNRRWGIVENDKGVSR